MQNHKTDAKINRRSFLKLASVAAAGAALPLVSQDIGLASVNSKMMVAQNTRMMMGTLVTITVLDPSAQKATDAMNAAFRRMADLTPVFDRHTAGTALNTLNNGSKVDAQPELISVLKLAESARKATGGAYDHTVLPVLKQMHASWKATGIMPDKAAIKGALSEVGRVRRSGSTLIPEVKGAGITLDGLAKGYIVDKGLEAIALSGCKNALINAGGDIGVIGLNAGAPWRVAITDPANSSKHREIVKLKTGALATSGNYEVFFDNEKLYHHIINPATGASPRTNASVSVKAATCCLADTMATACFVMEPGKAKRFLEKHNLQGMVLTRNHQKYMTAGFMG